MTTGAGAVVPATKGAVPKKKKEDKKKKVVVTLASVIAEPPPMAEFLAEMLPVVTKDPGWEAAKDSLGKLGSSCSNMTAPFQCYTFFFFFFSVFKCKSHLASGKNVLISLEEIKRRLKAPEGFPLTRLATYTRVQFSSWKMFRPLLSIQDYVTQNNIDAYIRLKYCKYNSGLSCAPVGAITHINI